MKFWTPKRHKKLHEFMGEDVCIVCHPEAIDNVKDVPYKHASVEEWIKSVLAK